MPQDNYKTDRDDAVNDFVSRFADECEATDLYGVCAINAPESYKCFTGARCDLATSQFLIRGLIQQLAKQFGVSETSFAAAQALYVAAMANGAIDEDGNLDVSKQEESLNEIKRELEQAYQNSLGNA